MIGGELLDLFLPNLCIGCQCCSDNPLCNDCLGGFYFDIQEPIQLPYIDSVKTLLPYDGLVKQCLYKIKFEGWSNLARQLSSAIVTFLDEPPIKDADIWTSVPINKHRLKKRGFNQVDLLFQSFLDRWALPYGDIFCRNCATSPLFDFTLEERKRMLSGVFSLLPFINVQSAKVVIMDDILTTGATLSELAKVLRFHGASCVEVVCFSFTAFKKKG